MVSAASNRRSVVNGIRTALAIGGVLAVIAGAIVLWQPAAAAAFVTVIVAMYAIAGGLVYAGLGFFSRSPSAWSRVGHTLLGLFFVVAGVVALVNLGQAPESLAVFIAVLVGILWIVEGAVSLTTLSGSTSKVWTVLYAVISIVAGLYLVFSPLLGALVLFWILGAMLVVLGIVQLARAFTWKGA